MARPYNDPDQMLKMSEHPEGLLPEEMRAVGKRVPSVDALKLALGKPAFTDDFIPAGVLHGKILHSPHAHAIIKRIDASKARALPGVHAVLTWQDIKLVRFTTAGQSHPLPSPLDTLVLDRKVRFVGDRVAAVAAETPEIAEQALALIEVEYETLPAIIEIEDALKPGAPLIHDEPDCSGFAGVFIPQRNIAAHFVAEAGDLASGYAEAYRVFEGEYRVPQVQHVALEPHVCLTFWDEDDRLTIRSATQVPFHVRRILAPVLGLPEKRIRVIKPRIGGGFGGKQEIVLEDICAYLTLVTGRPVRMEYTREEEFTAARSRHPQILRFKTGVRRDGTITAMTLSLVATTGAYGSHALTVQGNTGSKALALYRCPNLRFEMDVAYTNRPPAGAMRGYGAPQGLFALEVHMDEIAAALGLDPIEFRRRNWVQVGDIFPLAEALGEGRKGFPNPLRSTGLAECVAEGAKRIGWERRRDPNWHTVPGKPHLRRGLGMAALIHGSGIPGIDMGCAYLKMNDDGSFNLMFGATDLGTGADTVLAQIAAEVLGCRVDDIIVYAADTDLIPFDKGAYASSTTFVSGGAVKKAAEKVAAMIKQVASRMLETPPESLEVAGRARHCSKRRKHQPARGGVGIAARRGPAPDPGRRIAHVADVRAPLCRPVRRGRGRYRDRRGASQQTGLRHRLRPTDQPGRRGGADGRRDGYGPGLCALRGDAVRRGRPAAQRQPARLPRLPRRRDASHRAVYCPDAGARRPIRGEGRRRDSDGRGSPRNDQRHLRCSRRAATPDSCYT